MTRYRILYLLFFIFTVIMLFAYNSSLSSVLFLFAVLLPVISLILVLISTALLKTKIEYRTLSAEKNENLMISVKLTNRFIIPIAPAYIVGLFPYKQTSTFEYQNILVSIPPLSTVTISFNSSIKLRGEYKFGVEKLMICDLFKLFRLHKKIDRYEAITILPRKYIVNPIFETSDSDSESRSTNSFSLEKNNFSSIREYVAGDSVKNIHWKISAKHDTPMVKDFERSIGASSIIIADLNEYLPIDEDNCEACDAVIETMLALNLSHISQKQTCHNFWYSPENKRCKRYTVSKEEDFTILFDIFSKLPRQNETFLPENILNSITEVNQDVNSVYFITSQMRHDFINEMCHTDILRNKKIKILLLESDIFTSEQEELSAAIAGTTGVELWNINKDNLPESINNAIELYRKH